MEQKRAAMVAKKAAADQRVRNFFLSEPLKLSCFLSTVYLLRNTSAIISFLIQCALHRS